VSFTQEIGQKGEDIAKAYLEEKGYEILDENWCFKKAQVDLIAYKDKIIVFVEVKTRSSTAFGEPEDFVNSTQQRSLQKAADEYLYIMNHQGEIRFDIISILFNSAGNYTLKHIEDAFWPN
jgi:putative endonuclease